MYGSCGTMEAEPRRNIVLKSSAGMRSSGQRGFPVQTMCSLGKGEEVSAKVSVIGPKKLDGSATTRTTRLFQMDKTFIRSRTVKVKASRFLRLTGHQTTLTKLKLKLSVPRSLQHKRQIQPLPWRRRMI